MLAHLRASFALLLFTLVICSGLYPLTLWAIAQAPYFRGQAEGSLVKSSDGKMVVGSKLIAQPFAGEEYFQPRPSAVGYNAAASGASNWAASNYLLRDRVARQLGPIVRYGAEIAKQGRKPGDLVGPDIELWFRADRFGNKPGIVAQWAGRHASLAENWIKDSDTAVQPQWRENDKDLPPGQSLLKQIQKDDAGLYQALLAEFPKAPSAGYADLAGAFFPLFSKLYPGQWPMLEEFTDAGKKLRKFSKVTEEKEIQSVFFDMWRQDHPDVSLEEVPADMVMASGSGLDPDITLKNAQYQLKYRVAPARAAQLVLEAVKSQQPKFDTLDEKQRIALTNEVREALEKKLGKNLETRIREVINDRLTSTAHAPLGGLAGVPLVNVLEVNMFLDEHLRKLIEPAGHR